MDSKGPYSPPSGGNSLGGEGGCKLPVLRDTESSKLSPPTLDQIQTDIIVKCARCGLDATLVLEGQAFSIGLTCYMIGKGESIGLLACKTFDIKPQVT